MRCLARVQQAINFLDLPALSRGQAKDQKTAPVVADHPSFPDEQDQHGQAAAHVPWRGSIPREDLLRRFG